jgi:hypothetical protein
VRRAERWDSGCRLRRPGAEDQNAAGALGSTAVPDFARAHPGYAAATQRPRRAGRAIAPAARARPRA